MFSSRSAIFSAFLIGSGLVIAGYSIGRGIFLTTQANRSLTVKGIAEQEVRSDLGVWEVIYPETGDVLEDVVKKLQQDEYIVREFLKEKGFTDQEIERIPLKIEDRLANIYVENKGTNQVRYVIHSGLRVRSTHVERIQQATEMSNALVQKGVQIEFNQSTLSPNPSYYFMNLDAVRPKMMSDATKSAEMVANQFSKDSHVQLNGVKRASQGVFQIMNADTSTLNADWNSNQSALGSIQKKVRLVTTIEYTISPN